MLYRRTPEIPPLRIISNGEIQDAIFPDEGTASISSGELFLKSLWLEASLTKDADCRLPAAGKDNARTIVSRKCNADLFLKSNLNEICATIATIHDLSSSSITSEFIETSSITATVIATDNIEIEFGEISVLNSYDISSDFISVDNGQIDNISGSNLHYTNGLITELSCRDISTANITSISIADLSAAATYWADLAELYKSDSIIEPGTLVRFGGDNEIEIASDGIVNGVISKDPALLLNSSLKNNGNSNPLVLVGRSVVKVKGKIDKFDRVELSDTPGVAQKSSGNNKHVLGLTLESKSECETKPIECVVKLTF